MQIKYDSFDVLENELLEKMKNRGCSSITITGYRYLCNSIISWVKDNGLEFYTKEGGNDFLQDYLSKHSNNRYYSNLRTVVCRLNDLVDGKWDDVHSDKGKHFILSDEFIDIVNIYCSGETDKGLANGTIKHKRYAISWFFHELGKLQCYSLTQLSPKLLIAACTRITDHNLWGEIRLFLKYLVVEQKLMVDYSTLIPHYRKPYVIPSVYSIEEIKRIENSIDTSTIKGKRDYAIILLASRLGLHSGDIVKLKIEEITGKDELNIIQQKTGNALHLPLIDEVSSAIFDYLTVRPSSMAKEVFLSVYAPYKPISTGIIRNSLKKYMIAAGIDVGNRKKGPHALRSSLASSMVNDDISYETVRKVLGHSSYDAIKHYAKIDVEKLRRYCLEPPKVSGNFKVFLKRGGDLNAI